MIIVILLVIFVPFVVVSVVQGIVQYFRLPKPPKYSTYEEVKQWYNNKEWNALEEESQHDQQTEDKKAFLENQLQQLYEMGYLIEKELAATTDAKKRTVLLSKSISIDAKTYKVKTELEKLSA